MRKNISEVIYAFLERRAKSGKTCSTDGTVIRSYTTEIARRFPNGLVWVAPDGSSTATTNSQIRALSTALSHGSSPVGLVTHDCGHSDCHENAEMMRRCVAGEAGRIKP